MADRPRLLRTALALLFLVALTGPSALASPGGSTDPDDVDLRLDLKTISHTDDAGTVTYTLETWDTFPDGAVDFRWALDDTGDGKVDLYVSAQWEDDNRTLVATVDDLRERVLARASVTRPAPDAVRVSFPRAVLGSVTSYRYNVIAVTDLDGNGETDGKERDVAPDTGFYEHRLGPDPLPGEPQAGNPGGAPAGTPSSVTTQAAAAPPAAARTGPAGTSGTGLHASVSAVSPSGSRLAGPSHATGPPETGPPETGPAVAGAPPLTEVPRTGLPHEGLATDGVALLLLGLACRAIARKPDHANNLGGT